VHPHLVGASRFQPEFKEGEGAERFEPPVAGDRLPSPRRQHRHLLPVDRMPPDPRRHGPLVRRRASEDDPTVFPVHRVGGKPGGQRPVGGVGPRDHENPRGIPIKPVYDPRAGDAPDPGQGVGAPEERVHEGSAGVPRRGMNHHAGRLVDDQQVGIFIQHVEGKILGQHVERHGRGDDDGHRFPALQAGRRTHDFSRQPDVPLLDQPLPARPGNPGNRLRKVPVETFPRAVGRNGQPVRPARFVRHATRSSRGCGRPA
jgi:hypothetical protein